MNSKSLFIPLAILIPFFSIAQGMMLPYLSKEKYGVADEYGNVIIPPKYEAVITQKGIEIILVRQNGLWGVINAKDEILLPMNIEDAQPTNFEGRNLNGPEMKQVFTAKTYTESANEIFTGSHLYEVHDAAKEVLYYINPLVPQANYHAFRDFTKYLRYTSKFSKARSTGMVKVAISEGRFNFIDTTGSLILKENIEEGDDVSAYVLAVQNEDKLYALVDTKGKALTTYVFSGVRSTDNFEFIIAEKGSLKNNEKITYSLFDKYGKLLVSDLRHAISVEGNSAILRYDDKAQLMDASGKIFFENKEGLISSAFPRKDVFLFCQNNLNGIVSEDGKILLSPKYDQLDHTLDGEWLFKKGKSFGVIDNLFHVKWTIDSLDVEPEWNYDAGFILIKTKANPESNVGLLDTLGHVILEPVYSSIDAPNGLGPLLAYKDSLNGLFDAQGKTIISLTDSIIHVNSYSGLPEYPDPDAIYYSLKNSSRMKFMQKPPVKVTYKNDHAYLTDPTDHIVSQKPYKIIINLKGIKVNRALFVGYTESPFSDLVNEKGRSILPEGFRFPGFESNYTAGGLALIYYIPNEVLLAKYPTGAKFISGVINGDGNWVIPPDSTLKKILVNEFIKVQLEGAKEFTLYDRHGKLIEGGPFTFIPYLISDKEIPFDRLIVGRPENWKTYKRLEQKYAKTGDYNLLEKSNEMQLRGCIDHTGKTVIPFKYKFIGEFDFPFTEAYGKTKSGKSYTAIIDVDGNELIRTDYDELRILSGDSSLISFRKGDLVGLMDLKGQIIIPPKYTFIEKDKNAEEYILIDSFSTYIGNMTDPEHRIKVGPTGKLVFDMQDDLLYTKVEADADEKQYYSAFDSSGKLLSSYVGVKFSPFFLNRRLPVGYLSVHDSKDGPAYIVNFRTGVVYKSLE